MLSIPLPVRAQVGWRTRTFDEACLPGQRFTLPVESEVFDELGRVKWIGPNRLAMVQMRANRVQVLDERWKPVFSFGGRGSGPGEFQMATDLAVLADSTLAVTDPVQMRIHLFSPKGTFIRSFMTNRFPPKRIVGLPDGRMAVAGLSRVASRLQFAAIYSREGDRVSSWGDAPEPYASISPRIDDAVIARRGDGTLVLIPSVLDTVYQMSNGVTTQFGLGLPSGFWVPFHQVQHDGADREELKAAMESFSYIYNGGMMSPSVLGLAWRIGGTAGTVFAMLSLDRREGSLLTGMPGSLMGLHGETLWVGTGELDDKNIVQSFTCRLP